MWSSFESKNELNTLFLDSKEQTLISNVMRPITRFTNFLIEQTETSFFQTLALAIWSSLLRNDGHFQEVTVTWEVTSRWPRSLGMTSMEVTSRPKILEKIFLLNFAILGNFTSFRVKKFFWKFSQVTVTWSDEQMAISLEVTVSCERKTTVTSSSDERMARAYLNLTWL